MACKQENKKKFCPHAGSNYRPSVYKTDALPLSYRGHLVLPISHNLNNATFFFFNSLLLFPFIYHYNKVCARQRIGIKNPKQTQKYTISLSLSLSLSLTQWKTKTTPSILYSPNPQQIPIPLSFHFHYFLFIYNNFVYVSGSDSRYFQARLDTKSPRFEKSPFSLQIHHLLQFMFVKSFSNFGFFVFWVFSFSERERNDVADALDCEVC